MRYLIQLSIATLLTYCSQVKTQSKEINPLVGTNWRFIGFIQEDSIYTFPPDYNFTLGFDKKNRIVGETFGNYGGKYKIKAERIYLELWMSIGYNSALESFTGGAGMAMQLQRLYQSGLGMDRFSPFEIKGDELRVPSRLGTMLFKKSDDPFRRK